MKFLTVLSIASFSAVVPALANDGFEGFAKNYQTKWHYSATGKGIGRWFTSPTADCAHTVSCQCGDQNYCGTYTNDERALYWANGCDAAPAEITCVIR